MLVNIVKFLHMLCVLGLFGATLYCLLQTGSKKLALANTRLQEKITRMNQLLLGLGSLALLSGTLLVYPKHFTFHTPWIQAAYVLVIVFGLGIAALLILRKKMVAHRRLQRVAYLALIVILIAITHDAVTKTTFVF